jgi:hypothetical protein
MVGDVADVPDVTFMLASKWPQQSRPPTSADGRPRLTGLLAGGRRSGIDNLESPNGSCPPSDSQPAPTQRDHAAALAGDDAKDRTTGSSSLGHGFIFVNRLEWQRLDLGCGVGDLIRVEGNRTRSARKRCTRGGSEAASQHRSGRNLGLQA